VERSRRRFERHLEEARLPPGKTLDTFDFDAVPMVSKAQVQALMRALLWLGRRKIWRKQPAFRSRRSKGLKRTVVL
jgi:DNA replication protein DnaC